MSAFDSTQVAKNLLNATSLGGCRSNATANPSQPLDSKISKAFLQRRATYSGSLARIPGAISGSGLSSNFTRGDPWLPVKTLGEWSNVSGMINYQHRDHLRPPWGPLRPPTRHYQSRGSRGWRGTASFHHEGRKGALAGYVLFWSRCALLGCARVCSCPASAPRLI